LHSPIGRTAWLQPLLDNGSLVPILEEFSPPFPGWFLYYPKQRYAAPAIRALVDFLRRTAAGTRRYAKDSRHRACHALAPLLQGERKRSVLEVPDAGEHHGDPCIVGGLDDFVIADRTAGLDHCGGAGLDRHQQAVGEREKASEATTEPLVIGCASFNSTAASCACARRYVRNRRRLI